MVNTSKKNPPNFGCFSNIFGKFICKSNLPTNPCLLDEIIPEKIIQTKSDGTNKNNETGIVVRSRVQTQASPGIVARLMGLETIPTTKSMPSQESLFRSKSLNSLHLLPDFDPTRASFHRRARTSSASFHEQGHTLLLKIDEISEIDATVKMPEFKSGRDEFKQKKPEKRENVVNLKGNECRKSRKNVVSKNRPNKLRTSTNVVSNERNSREKSGIQRNKSLTTKDQNMKVVSNVSRKKKVDHKKGMDNVEVQSDVSTRSPVSVLDHHLEFDSPSTDDGNVILTTSPSRRKPARKIKLVDDPTPQYTNRKSNKNDDDSSDKGAREEKSVRNDAELAEYLMGLSGQVCELADAQLSKDMRSDIRRYELVKAQLVDDLCLDFGQEIVEFLLNELTDELSSFSFWE